MSFIVTAKYKGKIDDRREQSIKTAFKRYGIHLQVFHPKINWGNGVIKGMNFGMNYGEDVKWTENENGSEHELTIVAQWYTRAIRLASELRACGLVVSTVVE